jgi:hypothetical protein
VTATSATGVTGTSVVSVVAPLGNIATGKKATASSSTGGNTPDKALDGLTDQAHRWESKQGVDDQWWQVDLGASYDVSRIHVDWENAAARTYEVMLSDDPNGAAAPVRSVTKGNAAPDDLAVSGSGRYLRIHGLTRQTQYGYSILELGVYGTPSITAGAATQVLVSPQSSSVLPGRSVQLSAYAFDAAGNGGPLDAAATWATTAGTVAATGRVTAPASGRATVTATVGSAGGTATVDAFQQATVPDPTPTPTPTPTPSPALVDVALGRPATASSVEWKGTPIAAVDDGKVSTRWASAWGHDDEWVEVDLGKVTDISRISTNWEDAYATAFRIEVRDSADGAWRQVGDVRTGSKGETAYDVSTSGRFVRVHGVTRADARYGYSLYELGVFATQG